MSYSVKYVEKYSQCYSMEVPEVAPAAELGAKLSWHRQQARRVSESTRTWKQTLTSFDT